MPKKTETWGLEVTKIKWIDLTIVFSVFIRGASLLNCAAITPLHSAGLLKAMAPVFSGPLNLTFSIPLFHSVPCRRTVCKLTHSLEAGGVGFQSSYESEKHVPLFDFDVPTPVCMCLLSQCDVWRTRAWKMKCYLSP